MNVPQTYIAAGKFSINLEQVRYIEVSEEYGTLVHFSGGETLQLGEIAAIAFWKEWKLRSGSERLAYL